MACVQSGVATTWVCSTARSTWGRPSTMSKARGRTFATVITFTIQVACRTPTTLANRDEGHEQGHRRRSPAGRSRQGQDLGQVKHEHVQVGGGAQDPGPEGEPTDLEARERAEGLVGVEVGAARFLEAARDLGEAQGDGQEAEAREKRGQGAPGPGEAGQGGGGAEDRAADDHVDEGRGQIPSPDGSHERRTRRPRRRQGAGGRGGWGRARHRADLTRRAGGPRSNS